jgi:hypothetical protein
MARLQTPRNKNFRLVGIYLGLQALVFVAGIVDYHLLHKGDSPIMGYLGQLTAIFSVTGLLLFLYFLILRAQNVITGEPFVRCLLLALLGCLFPILVVFVVLSHLQ